MVYIEDGGAVWQVSARRYAQLIQAIRQGRKIEMEQWGTRPGEIIRLEILVNETVDN